MNIKIEPTLYSLMLMEAHDTRELTFTDLEVAKVYEQEAWDEGGIFLSSIYYANESIDGRVDWNLLK